MPNLPGQQRVQDEPEIPVLLCRCYGSKAREMTPWDAGTLLGGQQPPLGAQPCPQRWGTAACWRHVISRWQSSSANSLCPVPLPGLCSSSGRTLRGNISSKHTGSLFQAAWLCPELLFVRALHRCFLFSLFFFSSRGRNELFYES